MESMESELMLKARATVRLFFRSLLLLVASLGEPCRVKQKDIAGCSKMTRRENEHSEKYSNTFHSL